LLIPFVKIREALGEISIPIVEATTDRTIHLMAIHCAAAEHGGLIKKKKESKFMGKA